MMNSQKALEIKNAIAERFLATSRIKIPAIGFALAGASPRASAIVNNIRNDVNGVGTFSVKIL